MASGDCATQIPPPPEEVLEDKIETIEDVENEEKVEEGWAEIDKDGWEDILGSGRLRRRVLSAAKSDSKPNRGYYVKVNFEAKFDDEVFLEDQALEFFLSEGEVIQGLDLVVALMSLGEQNEFIADPEFAYGKGGYPPKLPPNAAVHCQVTLLEHRPNASSPTDLELEQRRTIGLRKKERGNFWYCREEFSQAVQCYRKAVEYFDDEALELEVPIDRYLLPQHLQDLLDDRIKTYNNLAQAQMKLTAWDSSLASLKHVLKIEPNNEKALFRKAKILEEKGCVDESVGILRRLVRLYPNNTQSQALLTKLTTKKKKNRRVEEELSKKMLGLDKYEEEQKNKSKWKIPRFFTVGLVVGGVGALLGGIVAFLKVQP